MILKKYLENSEKTAKLEASLFEGEGELTEIEAYAFYDHRELLEVYLPEGITKIGANAFYDCRNLQKISFYDRVENLGDGVFRNCNKLYSIEVKRGGGNLRALKDILLVKADRLLVNLYGNELLFPHYEEQYMDYYEARIIKQINHGAGIHYRECLNREELDYTEYDGLFRTQKYSMEEEEGILLSKARLLYPYLLKEEAKEEYLSFLTSHLKELLRLISGKRDMGELSDFIRTGIFSGKEETDTAIDFFCEKDFAEAVNLLMDHRDRTFQKTSILDLEI